MDQTSNSIRTTIYLDEDLVKKSKILFGEAEVSTFSQFVRKALDCYIAQLLTGNHGPELTDAIRRALAEEVKPIAVRLSKSLYRYAIELDMLTQIVAYAEIPFDALDDIRREAKLRVAQQRGRIDVNALLQEEQTKQLLEDMEDWK